MSRDEQRMHGHGNTPGLNSGRGHEHHEEPVRLNHPEPGEPGPKPSGGGHHPTADATMQRGGDQPAALGGHVATRTGHDRTPDDER